jgi:PEP-CTERM motif
VPAGTVANESLSFLGVDFGSNIVSRVRITNGNAALGPNEAGALDLVVMDDFLFGEPVAAVPEPSTLMLLFGGLLGLGVMWRWRNA